MIRSVDMYVSDVQRKKGVITCKPMMRRNYPPPITIYRQDFRGKRAARKIQKAWRESRVWDRCTTPDYLCFGGEEGAFSHMHGHRPMSATKVQAAFRGYMARLNLPMVKMQMTLARLLE